MLDMSVTWNLSLSTEQLNMIGRALRSALRSEELQEAKELANTLAAVRVKITKNKLAAISKLEENLENV